MITGAHAIVYTKDPDADRTFFRDVLKFSHVDVGGGWLIFGLPPAEVAVHPSATNDVHELYLICDDVEAFVRDMKRRGIATTPLATERWGVITRVTLPGGGKLGVYEPRHARPKPTKVRAAPATRGKVTKPKKPTTAKRKKSVPRSSSR